MVEAEELQDAIEQLRILKESKGWALFYQSIERTMDVHIRTALTKTEPPELYRAQGAAEQLRLVAVAPDTLIAGLQQQVQNETVKEAEEIPDDPT